MKVLIVDDHVLFRQGLGSLLRGHADFTVVGEAGTLEEAMEKARRLQPDLILMDIHLPDGSGIDVIKTLLKERPALKVVVLTAHESDEMVYKAIASGAKGFLLKNTPVSHLLASLRALDNGETALSRAMASNLIEELVRRLSYSEDLEKDINKLTARELDVLYELGTEASNQVIAQRLVISENTVKIHVHNILEKLGLQNRFQAANLARRLPATARRSRNDLANK